MGDSHLEVLQERCRRDPLSYSSDYVREVQRLRSLLDALALGPVGDTAAGVDHTAHFVANLSGVYGAEARAPAEWMLDALAKVGVAMDPHARRGLVKALAMMRARGVVGPLPVLKVFLGLLECKDKALRRELLGQIVADLRRPMDDLTRKQMQNEVFSLLTTSVSAPGDADELQAKRILSIVLDLFRKRTWRDARTANVIAESVFHASINVMVMVARFLTGEDDQADQDSDSDSDSDTELAMNSGSRETSMRARALWSAYAKTSKKSTRKRKKLERVVAKMRKRSNWSSCSSDSSPFAAVMLINDPQTYAERLFSDLQNRRKNERFEARLALLNLITRLVGAHQLLLLNLYPFLQRYLQPHQAEVTRILAYLAQACHTLVPPDVCHPVIRTLADHFVSDRCSGEAVAAGLNAIRTICSRVPLAIEDAEQEDDLPRDEAASALLQDLVEYKSSRDKGVAMAARSLLQLYREVNPVLLKRKDRGKDGTERAREGQVHEALRYGQTDVARGVEGADLLNESSGSGTDEEEGTGEEDDSEGVGSSDDEAAEDVDEEGSVEVLDGSDAEDGDDDDDDDDDSDDDEDDEDDEEMTDASGSNDEANGADQTAVDRLRVLTDEDFERIRRKQGELDLSRALGRRAVDTSKAVDPADIEAYQVRQRRTLEERLESVRAGREGREKFGSRLGRRDKVGGTSNREKRRQKAHSMVLHKNKRKRHNESFKERQKRQTAQRKPRRNRK